MTKANLIKALEPFEDDIPIFVSHDEVGLMSAHVTYECSKGGSEDSYLVGNDPVPIPQGEGYVVID